jgi:hypothetical protein
MKNPGYNERFVRWCVKKFTPGYHLAKNSPGKKGPRGPRKEKEGQGNGTPDIS